MMMNSAVFVGSSHFQGLGLEIELSERYNSIDWLNKNGVKEFPKYISSDYNIHRNNRWPFLLSQKLNVNERNVSDDESLGKGGDIQFFENLFNNKIDLENVKYIFLELNSIHRLYYKLQNYTSAELLNLLKENKLGKLEENVKLWLDNNTKGITYNKFKSNLVRAIKEFPSIKFYVVDWYNISDDKLLIDFPNHILVFPNYRSIYEGLEKNKFLIQDTSFCYTYNNITWNIDWYDLHANKIGNEELCNLFFRQINKKII